MYVLEITDNAKDDIEFHRKAGGVKILKKISVLLNELRLHPFSGTGKPEALKYDLEPNCSVELIRNTEWFIMLKRTTSIYILYEATISNCRFLK